MSIPKDIQEELVSIERAKRDRKYFAPLYEKYYKRIFLFIYKKVQDDTLTGDICSKTFMKAMLNIDKYEYKGFPFSSWLYRIACNEVNMYFRENSKIHSVEIMEKDAVSVMSEFESDKSAIQVSALLTILEQLPEEQSQLIELRFFEQLSFKEIGSIFAITEANAKMKIYRILHKLELKLKNAAEA